MDSFTRQRRGSGGRDIEVPAGASEPDYQAALGQEDSEQQPAPVRLGEMSPGMLEQGGVPAEPETPANLFVASPFHSEKVKSEVELLRSRPATLDDDGRRAGIDYDEAALGDSSFLSGGREPDYSLAGHGSRGGAPKLARVEIAGEHAVEQSGEAEEQKPGIVEVQPETGRGWEITGKGRGANPRDGSASTFAGEKPGASDARELIPDSGFSRMEQMMLQVMQENAALRQRLEAVESQSSGLSGGTCVTALEAQVSSPMSFAGNVQSCVAAPRENRLVQMPSAFPGNDFQGYLAGVEDFARGEKGIPSQGVPGSSPTVAEGISSFSAPGAFPEEPAKYIIDLPKLAAADLTTSAVTCGNWLAQTRQVFAGLSPSASVWFSSVEGAANASYQRWLVADPLERLALDPSTVVAHYDAVKYQRVESRAAERESLAMTVESPPDKKARAAAAAAAAAKAPDPKLPSTSASSQTPSPTVAAVFGEADAGKGKVGAWLVVRADTTGRTVRLSQQSSDRNSEASSASGAKEALFAEAAKLLQGASAKVLRVGEWNIDETWLCSAVSASNLEYALIDSGATNALRFACSEELRGAESIRVDLASGVTELHVNEYGTLLSPVDCQLILPAGYLVSMGYRLKKWKGSVRHMGCRQRSHWRSRITTLYSLSVDIAGPFKDGRSFDPIASGRDRGRGYKYFIAAAYSIPLSPELRPDLSPPDDLAEYCPSECEQEAAGVGPIADEASEDCSEWLDGVHEQLLALIYRGTLQTGQKRLESFGYPVHRYFADRAKELRSHALIQWLRERGIRASFTAGEDPAGNKAEVSVQRLKQDARKLLRVADLPIEFWPFAILHASQRHFVQMAEALGVGQAVLLPFGVWLHARKRLKSGHKKHWETRTDGSEQRVLLTNTVYPVDPLTVDGTTVKLLFGDSGVWLGNKLETGDYSTVEALEDRWVIAAYAPRGTWKILNEYARELESLGFDSKGLDHLFAAERASISKFNAEGDEDLTSEGLWEVEFPCEVLKPGWREHVLRNHLSSALACKALVKELSCFGNDDVGYELIRTLKSVECQREWYEGLLWDDFVRNSGSMLKALNQDVPLNPEDQTSPAEAFLQTRTVSLAEAKGELVLWIPSATEEVVSLEQTNEAVERIVVSDIERLIQEGKRVTQVPGKAVLTRKAGVGKRRFRCVACGNYIPTGSPDSNNLYASGVESLTVRTALGFAAYRGWAALSADIRTAFLHAPLDGELESEEIIIVRPPSILVDMKILSPNHRWRVRKALYGLRQAPLAWARFRDKSLRVLTFQCDGAWYALQQGVSDDSLWFITKSEIAEDDTERWHGILIIYVDDLLGFASSVILSALFDEIQKLWKLSEPEWIREEAATKFCGLEIQALQRGGYRISQVSYLQELFARYDVTSSASAPLSNWTDPENEQQVQLETVRKAQALTGALLWASSKTRPDIAFAVSKLGQYAVKAPSIVIESGHQILRYLYGTADLWLEYQKPSDNSWLDAPVPRTLNTLELYTDASHAPNGGRSCQAMVILWGGNVLCWESCRQPFVTLSSTEAELVAVTAGIVAAESIGGIIEEMIESDITVSALCDNQAAVRLSSSFGSQGSVSPRTLAGLALVAVLSGDGSEQFSETELLEAQRKLQVPPSGVESLTVRTALSLAAYRGLAASSADVRAAFLHAPLNGQPESEEIVTAQSPSISVLNLLDLEDDPTPDDRPHRAVSPRVPVEGQFFLGEGWSSSESESGDSTTEPSIFSVSSGDAAVDEEVWVIHDAEARLAQADEPQPLGVNFRAEHEVLIGTYADDEVSIALQGWSQAEVETIVTGLNEGEWTSDRRWVVLLYVLWLVLGGILPSSAEVVTYGDEPVSFGRWDEPTGSSTGVGDVCLEDEQGSSSEEAGSWDWWLWVACVIGIWEIVRALSLRVCRSRKTVQDQAVSAETVPWPLHPGIPHRANILYCYWRAGYVFDVQEYPEAVQSRFYGLLGSHLERRDRDGLSSTDSSD
ncbi:RE2 [Symbiodinium natans]|uniref:RE2 protein n=1 Tax=Symbiodinium natans TaxID=878477 RepID=A0A812SUV0_9DINO|nr:RE2 [Symbiodinium natans]